MRCGRRVRCGALTTAQPSLSGVPEVLLRATLAMLACAAAGAALMAVMSFNLIGWAQEGDAVFVGESADPDPWFLQAEVPVRVAVWLVWLITGGLWAAWFASALSAAAGLRPPRISPAVAVTLLFAPLANWIWPKRALDDAWRAAGAKPGFVLHGWWLLTVIFAVAVAFALASLPADPEVAWASDYVDAYRADVVAYALGTLCAAIAIPVTWRLTTNLRAMRAAGGTDAPPPEPAGLVAARRLPAALRAVRAACWLIAAFAGVSGALWIFVAVSDPSSSSLRVVGLVVFVASLLALPLIPLAAFWLAWLHAAARAAGRPRPAWDVAVWFLPVANLVVPWRTLRRLVPDASRTGEVLRALRRAQGSYALAFAVSLPASVRALPHDESPAAWRWYLATTTLQWSLSIVSTRLLVRITTAIGHQDPA